MTSGQVTSAGAVEIDLGFDLILSHLSRTWAPLRSASGWLVFRMMVEMAARNLLLDGAIGISV